MAGKNKKNNTNTPVWGCVLIGGRSRRMGVPKHLLRQGSLTWLELVCARLAERTERVVISGNGVIPERLAHIARVPDIPGLHGPLAGILSVLRHYPGISWLIAACDMPAIETAALDWLLDFRAEGIKAVLPALDGRKLVEPLLAYYDSGCTDYLEEIAASGPPRPGRLIDYPGVITPQPPGSLRSSWLNINTAEELQRELHLASSGRSG